MTLADTDAPTTTRSADTSVPLLSVLAERWSPRAYDPDAEVTESALIASLEAARWAPSASNTQPWRFLVGRRGTETFRLIHDSLMGGNQGWAAHAGVLVANIATATDDAGNALPWATYDLGQAVASLSVQAHYEGLHVHQMGGFDAEELRTSVGLDERFAPVSVTAIGVVTSPDRLPDALREREVAPRQRVALDALVLRRD